MAVKRIEMAKYIQLNEYEAQFLRAGHDDAVERNEKRLKWLEEYNAEFDAQLNEALNDGYQIVARYEVPPTPCAYEGFILHKPDRPESGNA